MHKRVQARPGLCVLCVDPVDKAGRFWARLLSHGGHRAECAEDGEQAWTKLAQNLNFFEVVVTAHRMPKLNGLELVGRLRNAHYPGRIVVLGSSLRSTTTDAYRRFSVDAVLSKRNRADELLRIIEVFHAARWGAPSG